MPHLSHSEISQKAVEKKVQSFHNARTPIQGTHTHTTINPRCEGKISKRADINLFGCPALSSSLFFSFFLFFFSLSSICHTHTQHTYFLTQSMVVVPSEKEKERKGKGNQKEKGPEGKGPFPPFPPFPITDPTCSRLHNTKAETLLSPYRHPVRPGEALGVTADFLPTPVLVQLGS